MLEQVFVGLEWRELQDSDVHAAFAQIQDDQGEKWQDVKCSAERVVVGIENQAYGLERSFGHKSTLFEGKYTGAICCSTFGKDDELCKLSGGFYGLLSLSDVLDHLLARFRCASYVDENRI